MGIVLLKLYKVTWKHTANSYVVCKECDQEKVMRELEREDGRYDDEIIGIEEVFLPAFNNDNTHKNDYVRLFLNLNIL